MTPPLETPEEMPREMPGEMPGGTPGGNPGQLPDLPQQGPHNPAYFQNNAEYRGQVGLSVIHAATAYSFQATGKDVVIGFTDTGLDETHPEFPAGKIVLNDRSAYGAAEPDKDKLKHGTGVASIAAGQRGSGDGIHGVAYDAQVAMWTLELDERGYLTVTDNIFNAGLRALDETANARVMNHSWGYSIPFDPKNAGHQYNVLQKDFGASIARMAQDPAIHVLSAGNDKGEEVSITAAMPMLFPELRDKTLIVVAVDSNGKIGSKSNKCGHASDLCLAAPGGYNSGALYVRAASVDGRYRPVVGTSFAAPHVAGAVALLVDLFDDQMSNKELIDRLLLTADKSGDYGDKLIYGQGLLDLEAAINPVGTNFVPLEDNRRIRVDDSGFDFSTIGAALDPRFADRKILITDSLGAPFQIPLSVFDNSGGQRDSGKASVSPTEDTVDKTAAQSHFVGRRAFSRAEHGAMTLRGWHAAPIDVIGLVPVSDADGVARDALRNPFLALAGTGPIAQLAGEAGDSTWQVAGFSSHRDIENHNTSNNAPHNDQNDKRHIAGMVSAYQQRFGRMSLGMQTGVLVEQNAVLGAHGRGAFELSGHGRTFYAGLGAKSWLWNQWAGALGVYYGRSETDSATDGQLLTSMDNVQASGYEMVMWKSFGAQLARFRVRQPLRAETGEMNFKLPVRRKPGGAIIHENFAVPLNPDRREIITDVRFSRQFRHGLFGKGLFNFDLQANFNPQNHREKTVTWGVRSGLKVTF